MYRTVALCRLARNHAPRNLRYMANETRQRGNEPGPVSAAVSEGVAARRNELGWTRRELADRLSAAGRRFTPEAVQKLETNGRRIDVDDLATLSAVLDVPAADLLGIGQAKHRSSVADFIALGDRNSLLRRALHISIVDHAEPRPLLLDYVDHAARTWPQVTRFETDYQAWVAAVRAADDTQAAAMIVAQWASDGAEPPSGAEVALIVGSERAATVHQLMTAREDK